MAASACVHVCGRCVEPAAIHRPFRGAAAISEHVKSYYARVLKTSRPACMTHHDSSCTASESTSSSSATPAAAATQVASTTATLRSVDSARFIWKIATYSCTFVIFFSLHPLVADDGAASVVSILQTAGLITQMSNSALHDSDSMKIPGLLGNTATVHDHGRNHWRA